MDKLDEIFKKQSELDAFINSKRDFAKHYSKEDWVQKKCMALMDELGELLDEVNYKWWKNPKPLNKDAIAEELIDILHFWVSICLDMGLTPTDIHSVYLKKNQQNKDRQTGIVEKEGYKA